MHKRIKIAIIGGSGYGGSELLRILLAHPNAEIILVTAGEHSGRPVTSVHKNLERFTDLVFDEYSPGELPEDLDIAFFALPHGHAARLIPTLPKTVRAIDLSGDFRIEDPAVFERFYGFSHPGELQKEFVYGLTENNRDAIRNARFVANPGCFATATLLALAPIVTSGLTSGPIIVDAKTGSSGSGAKPAANTHHPQRMNSFYAYKPFAHQHLPEIKQHLSGIESDGREIVFMTHSMPVSRGIFASCYLRTVASLSAEDLTNLYRQFYADSFFIRIRNESPDINWVKTTNFCDISVHTDGKDVAIFAAIDNLVKGAAGQAVQNMNLMFGLDESAGLRFSGTNP
ncbi:MAG: N-acetyl-gamma-glutamyl-phosphate reductase [Blastocatellia bacterium]